MSRTRGDRKNSLRIIFFETIINNFTCTICILNIFRRNAFVSVKHLYCKRFFNVKIALYKVKFPPFIAEFKKEAIKVIYMIKVQVVIICTSESVHTLVQENLREPTEREGDTQS